MRLYEFQLPKNQWELVVSNGDKEELGTDLVSLVRQAYSNTPQGSFVNSIKDVIPSDWNVIDWDEDPDVDSCVFYRKNRGGENWSGHKIQGIGHDGTRTSKDKAISKVQQLLAKPGVWIESSDAMRHLLKKLNVPSITDEQTLQRLFNDSNLKMISDDTYVRQLTDGSKVTETVFGNPKLKVATESVTGGGIGPNWRGTEPYRHLVDEGWKDWVAGAAMGAAALAPQAADAKPIKPTMKPAIVQPAQAEPAGYNVLSNNPANEITLLKTAKASGIKGQELAQFLAQMKHESWDFNRMKEKAQPGVKDYYAKRYDMKYSPKTAKILGNKHAGDGARYHGRGFVQLTGRDNYRMASEALGIDLLKHPELAERPDVAAKVAVWYWQTRVKPHVQNFADTKSVTQKINPAARGLENRHENFKDYMRII